MTKINKHIVIVRTEIVHQSSMGEKSALMIQGVLSKHYEDVSVATINNVEELQLVVNGSPDLIFLGLKRTGVADDVWVSEYLEQRGINYTGSKKAAIALDINKNLAKAVVHKADLATALYFMAEVGQYSSQTELPLPFPLFIKPPTQGGGKGVAADSIVRSFEEYQLKVAQIDARFNTPSLVESYLEGREFSVALLGEGGDVIAMPVELITEANELGDRILGAAIKSADTEHLIAIPKGRVRDELTQLAKDVYQALGARDYGRIDIRMDNDGTGHFLEANLVPGLANNDFISYFTHACMLNENLNYEAMILKIVKISFARDEIEEAEAVRDDQTLLSEFQDLQPAHI